MESLQPLEFLDTKSSRNVETMISELDQDLNWYASQSVDSYDDPWDTYQLAVDSKFSAFRTHYDQLNTLGRILSIQDYWDNGGVTECALINIPLEQSGQVFVQTAQTVYFLREKQLVESFKLSKRSKPAKILSSVNDYRLTMKLEGKLASRPALVQMGEKLRSHGDNRLGQPTHWARPLVEHLLPLADTSQTRLSETRLGVGYGLMMAHATYADQLKLAGDMVRVDFDRSIADLEARYVWDEFGFDIEEDDSTE